MNQARRSTQEDQAVQGAEAAEEGQADPEAARPQAQAAPGRLDASHPACPAQEAARRPTQEARPDLPTEAAEEDRQDDGPRSALSLEPQAASAARPAPSAEAREASAEAREASAAPRKARLEAAPEARRDTPEV